MAYDAVLTRVSAWLVCWEKGLASAAGPMGMYSFPYRKPVFPKGKNQVHNPETGAKNFSVFLWKNGFSPLESVAG